jgi:nitrogen fixation-related uncharacterized protein
MLSGFDIAIIVLGVVILIVAIVGMVYWWKKESKYRHEEMYNNDIQYEIG